MQLFKELGALIETRWREKDYCEGAFPSIAAGALRELELPEHVDPWEIVRWVHTTADLPEQMDLPAKFGDPPITLYVGPRFYIDIYFWLDGTTSIHQHAFSGAFQVLLGGSVHAHYDFEKLREINPHFLTGKISLREASLLRKGDVREIVAGPEFIHSLFHLERPSATITVRTYKTPSAAVQYSYLKPFLASNPFFTDPLLEKKVQTVNLLLRMKHPDADNFIGDIIDSSDFQTTYSVLDSAFEFLCHRELEEIMGLSRSRDRFTSLLNRARGRHGEDVELLLPVFEEEWRQKDIARRRAEIKDEDHRFFLAMLLNVPDRAKLLTLVKKKFPERDPVDLVVEWVRELAAIKIFGSREANVLGLGEFNDAHVFVFRQMLDGRTVPQIERKASAEGIAEPIQALAEHIENLSVFKSLFAG